MILIVSILQLIYNLANFTKSPKSQNLFQYREARLSLLANLLHLSFCYFMALRWISGTPFSTQEKIIFAVIHILISLLRFSNCPLKQSSSSSESTT